MKKKLIILICLLGVLLVAGTLFYLYKTGKLASSADTTTKTYTITGRSFDPLANAPMPGQTITVTNESGAQITVQTNANGEYTVRIASSTDGLINVRQGEGGMEGDSCSLITDAENLTKTCNFNLGKSPFDEDAFMQFFNEAYPPVTTSSASDAKAVLAASEPDLSQFEWIEIGGVSYKPFATIKDPKYKVDPTGLKDQLDFSVKWLQTLKNTTGVTDNFPVMIVSDLDWEEKDCVAYMTQGWENGQPWHPWMVVEARFLRPFVISHEFAHHVDYVKGFDDRSSKHRSSSDNWYFRTAFQAAVKSGAVTGYATKNQHEMFAEFFASIMLPVPNDPTKVNSSDGSTRHLLELFLSRYLLQKPEFEVTKLGCDDRLKNECISEIMPTKYSASERIPIHNSLMYIYKHVAKASLQDEYFPGTVPLEFTGSGLQPWITEGYYMDGQGVLTTTILDHQGAPIAADTKVTIAGQTQNICEEETWWASGTCAHDISKPVLIGDQKLTVSDLPSDYPVPFTGQTVFVQRGSNYVEVKYRKFTVRLDVHPKPGQTFPTAQPDSLSILKIAGTFELPGGQKITGLVKGTIPRYPNEGTLNGLGLADAADQLSAYDRFYSLNFIVGGSDDQIFPIKASILGPAAMPKIYTNSATESIINKKDVNSDLITTLEGILDRKCYDEQDPSLFICKPLPWTLPRMSP